MSHTSHIHQKIQAIAIEEGDCLLWPMSCCNGHPAVSANGKTHLVRRLLWQELHGPIPAGKVITTTCQDKLCVQAGHMVLTTHQKIAAVNGKAGIMSGPLRSARIAAVKRAGHQAKLTDADITRIRTGTETTVQLARALGVSQPHISKVRQHKCRVDFSSPFAGLGARS
jgi:hypothetical protein